MTANAALPVERFRQQDETTQLILTEEACVVLPNPDKLILFKAYALDVPTGRTYEGCWEMFPTGDIHIELIIADQAKLFNFVYPQSDFALRPNL